MAELYRRTKVDRDGLHRFLHRKANARGRLEIRVGDLADDLGVNREHMGRILREMTAAGRLRKVKATVTGVWTYEIVDPDEWVAGARSRSRQPVWQ